MFFHLLFVQEHLFLFGYHLFMLLFIVISTVLPSNEIVAVNVLSFQPTFAPKLSEINLTGTRVFSFFIKGHISGFEIFIILILFLIKATGLPIYNTTVLINSVELVIMIKINLMAILTDLILQTLIHL